VLLGRVGPRQVDYALVLAELVDLLVHRQVFIDDIRLVEELMPGWQLALHFAQVEIEAILESIRLAPLVYHLVPQFLLLGLRFLFPYIVCGHLHPTYSSPAPCNKTIIPKNVGSVFIICKTITLDKA